MLVERLQTRYEIRLQPKASDTDRQAAEELARYIFKSTKKTLPIVSGLKTDKKPAIWIASAGRVLSLPATPDWNGLEEDGFHLLTKGEDLIIAGGTEKGVLYGVYAFLEEYMGCRKYSPEVEVVPKLPSLKIPQMDDRQVPRIKFRETHYHTAFDPGYRRWRKLDTHRDEWGMWVHTFDDLVPPKTYFDSHPEYFSEINGIRIQDGQLCLTNEAVFKIVVENLKKRMAKKPKSRYWSVSQNDTFNPCRCESCRAIDEAEGGHSGSLIHFVNKVAKEFPDKIISTLAYQYTRSAPKKVRPAKNVNIVLCSIECNRSMPLESDPTSASFVKDVEEWGKITDNILIWDYVVQFRNLVSPFPNLRVLQPNIQFFLKNGVIALFQQGSGGNVAEFSELRSYLISKLLWNPDLDFDQAMNDFLNGYYGKAGLHIRQYIDHMHDSLEQSEESLEIYGYPYPSDKGHLSLENIKVYQEIFDKAEAAVGEDEELLKRVQTARLPLQFARLEQAKIFGTGESGFFKMEKAWIVKPEMLSLLDTFVSRCEAAGIKRLWELGTPPREYHEVITRFLNQSMQPHLALFKPVTLTFLASKKYHNGDKAALTNGLKGIEDYHMNWLGFEAASMEAIIDLEKVQDISSIHVDFLQDVMAWVWLPQKVTFFVSEDGKSFQKVKEIVNTVSLKKGKTFIHPFAAEFEPVPGRYVKVFAENLKTCPRWHKGAGGKAWIFADEVIVK